MKAGPSQRRGATQEFLGANRGFVGAPAPATDADMAFLKSFQRWPGSVDFKLEDIGKPLCVSARWVDPRPARSLQPHSEYRGLVAILWQGSALARRGLIRKMGGYAETVTQLMMGSGIDASLSRRLPEIESQ